MSRSSDSPADIKPRTPVASLDRAAWSGTREQFPLDAVAPVVGMSPAFIVRVLGRKRDLSVDDVVCLLDQDAFRETFVPRSRVLDYLSNPVSRTSRGGSADPAEFTLLTGHVMDRLADIAPESVHCVVTSSPYWGMRTYSDSHPVTWADGELCAYGHEQTADAFVRHTVQVLHAIRPLLTARASIWWNLGDTYNTRARIRGSAVETLHAMQRTSMTAWREHRGRRYSGGHSYLHDGEQCLIPHQVAERASRLGYYVKSMIVWVKTSSTPEPHTSRASRALEYIVHLATTRAPTFDKTAYWRTDPELGGRNVSREPDRLTDTWVLPTSSGGHGHGAQFPIALPGRCIALSTAVNNLVLDPFVAIGNSGVAARTLARRFVGIDISPTYLARAREAINTISGTNHLSNSAMPQVRNNDISPVPRRLNLSHGERGEAA